MALKVASQSDEYWMGLALEQAQLAEAHGDVPVGCVVVDDAGNLLGAGHNRREIDADPIAHAEVVAMQEACRSRDHWRLHDCTVYVTLEPCLMCAGAMINARVRHLVFGASDPKGGAIHSLYRLSADERLNHQFDHRAGVSKTESVALLQGFFRALRAQGKK